MHPVIIVLNGWEVKSYTVVLFLSIIVGVVLFWKENQRVDFSKSQPLLFCSGAILSGLAGGLINTWLFKSNPGIFNLENTEELLRGGLTSFGSIVGLLGFTVIYTRLYGFSFWFFGDLIAPIIPLVEGIMRWGCLLNGCCYGSITNGFWGIYLPDSIGHWVDRYPTQIMTSIFCIGLFQWLWRRRKTEPVEGNLILFFLAIYHLGRFGIDAFRGDQILINGYISLHQLVSLAVDTTAVGLMIVRNWDSYQEA